MIKLVIYPTNPLSLIDTNKYFPICVYSCHRFVGSNQGGSVANPLKVSLENIIPLTEARDHFSQIVNEVQKDKLYILTKGGKPAVAIVDVKYLEQITSGNVNTSHVETEIQKNPAKVGRPEMVKHDSPQPTFNKPAFIPPAPKPFTPPPAPKPFTPPPAPKPAVPVSPPKPFTPPSPTSSTPASNPFTSSNTSTPPSTPPATPTSPSTPPTATPAATIDMHPIADPDDQKKDGSESRVSPDDKPNPAPYTPPAQNNPSPAQASVAHLPNQPHVEPDDMQID